MIKLDSSLSYSVLLPRLERLWQISGEKILRITSEYDAKQGSPVFTRAGKYTTRGWTEWTQGFQYGSEILQFDATGETSFLESGRENTLKHMAGHVTHFGVHDHGFNNVSTYGNLLRLIQEGRIPQDDWERRFYEMALMASSAVQARRWTALREGGGYIYSFNGPHSLFADTIRSLRVLAVGHQLGHIPLGENDRPMPLLERLVQHGQATAKYSVYYGEGRDSYDLRGRVAHESVFNLNDGVFRCPNSQQGYSPFSTWTRGLAWVMTGFAEQLEFLAILPDSDLEACGGREAIRAVFEKAALACCDFYIEHTPTDGIPYWDTGAPNLHRIANHADVPADPYNEHEPVDSSAAAIGAQGLLRLGRYLGDAGQKYTQAGLTVLNTLLQEPYLSLDASHHGLLLHSVYHRPNGWDYIPPGRKIPCGESSMWGDYHMRELALLATRQAKSKTWYSFHLPATPARLD